MSDPRQIQLYQQVILDHNKQPRNFGELENPTHKAEGYNPLCGDHIWVYLTVNDDVVEAVQFKGEGCAICKASTSLMTTSVASKNLSVVKSIAEEFLSMVKGDLKPDQDENKLGKLKIFSTIWHYPARVKCAALGWHTLLGALEKETTVSTE